jgi:hypothetical protein
VAADQRLGDADQSGDRRGVERADQHRTAALPLAGNHRSGCAPSVADTRGFADARRFRRAAATSAGRGGHAVQPGILAQDGALQFAQRRTGLDAQLVDHRLPPTAEDVERVGLPTTSVQREHQQAAGFLA